MHFITICCFLRTRKASLCVADICAMIGCVGSCGNVGKVPGFKCGVKIFPVIFICFCRVTTRPKKPWLPPPNSVGIEAAFCISFFSIGLIE